MPNAPAQPIFQKTAAEVQRAHDLLVGIIVDDELRALMLNHRDDLKLVSAATDVLCWLLGHAHNQEFAKNLEAFERAMLQQGYILNDTGKLHPGEERPCPES